jgi:hypothetical protein
MRVFAILSRLADGAFECLEAIPRTGTTTELAILRMVSYGMAAAAARQVLHSGNLPHGLYRTRRNESDFATSACYQRIPFKLTVGK